MNNKEKIIKALSACSEFCCGECPYQHLDDKHYTLRCIHALIKDVYELFKKGRLVICDQETILSVAKENAKVEEDKLELLKIIDKLTSKQ